MMNDTSTTAQFKVSVPTLPVRDAMAAQKYYCDVLGFEPEFMVNDGNDVPHFCGVSRDGVRVYLTTVDGEVRQGECSLVVDDVDAIHAEFKAKGVRIKRDPRDAPWGRYFTMLDLDGNHLTIGVK